MLQEEKEKYLKFYRLFYEVLINSGFFYLLGYSQDKVIDLMILTLQESKDVDKDWLTTECKRWYRHLTNKEWPKKSRGIGKNRIFYQKGVAELLKDMKQAQIYKEKEEEEYIKTKKFRETERLKVNKAMRFRIFKRDKFTCQYCGRKPPEVILQVDHMKPISKGGKSTENNMKTACRDCNIGKFNNPL